MGNGDCPRMRVYLWEVFRESLVAFFLRMVLSVEDELSFLFFPICQLILLCVFRLSFPVGGDSLLSALRNSSRGMPSVFSSLRDDLSFVGMDDPPLFLDFFFIRGSFF